MQFETERGLISVSDMFTTKEKAKENGYSFTFHSTKLDCDCYSISIDFHHKQFALVYDRELTFSESQDYIKLGMKDFIKVPYSSSFYLSSKEAYDNIGKYLVHTNSQGRDSIFAVRRAGEKVCLDKIYSCRAEISLNYKGRYNFYDKAYVDKLLEDRGITVDKLESINKYNKKQKAILRDL